MACVRILIADDHELVRQGMRALLALRPAWEVCGEACDGVEAIGKAAQLRPDVVLLDVSMPRLSGLEAASQIRRVSPASKILIISQHDPEEMLPKSLAAGARGFVSKSDIGSHLLTTIESILGPREEGAWVPGSATATVDPQPQRDQSLLREQNRLLELIVRGRPLDECLRAITESVALLGNGLRAAVTVASPEDDRIERMVSAWLPIELMVELTRFPLGDASMPTPRDAVLRRGEVITVNDIAGDPRWAARWGELWSLHGVRALEATPVRNTEGVVAGAFLVCFAEARQPSAWERDLGQFGAHLASLAIERHRAEATLRASEQKFRTLFESIDQGFCVLERLPSALGTPDFRFLQVNPGFTVHTGVGDISGRTLRQTFPEAPAEWFHGCDHILQTGESRKFEREQLQRGRVLELYVFRVEDGTQLRLGVLIKDITERKRAEAFVLCQKSAFEKVASGMPLMEVLEFLAVRTELHLGARIAIHLLDATGKRFDRTAAPSLPGEYREWLSGVAVSAAAIPCCVAIAQGERLNVVHGRENATFPEYAAFAARHGIHSSWFLPIQSSRLQPLGVIACHYADTREPQVRDNLLSGILARTASVIIERRQVEEVVRQRSAQFEILVDQAPIGVFLLDGLLRIRQVNPAALPAFGATPDLVGRDYGALLREIRAPQYAEQVLRLFRQTLASGESHHLIEQPLARRDHPQAEYYDWRVDRIPLPEGGYGVVCYFREVSAEIQARAALREARDHLESRVRERTEELESAYKSLRMLSMRMMQMQDEDRRRIARDLHDSAGQLLAALGMELASLNHRAASLYPELAGEIDGSLQLVQQLTQEIRTASYLLHPPLLDDAGLSGALRWYVTGLSKRSGIAIRLELDDALGRLPRELEAAVFHIVQESLTNIHRHSGSKTATLRIARTTGQLVLEIEDAGSGIPADKLREIQAQGSGVGIAGMRERVLHFHGNLHITSVSTGTRIAVTFPVEPGSARPAAALN